MGFSIIGFFQYVVKDHIKYLKTQPRDFMVYVILNILIVLTLYYGVIIAFPSYCDSVSCCKSAYYLNYLWGLWLYVAEQANLQLIRIRSSSVFKGKGPRPPITTSERKGGGKSGATLRNGNRQSGGHRSNNKSPRADKLESSAGSGNNNNSLTAWHYCKICARNVPPRSWHCNLCKTCILRRDHHCVFAMQCIGQDNHGNFMGFLFYTAAGTLYATVLGMLNSIYVQGDSFLWWFIKSTLVFFTVMFDWSGSNFLRTLNFIGCLFSLGFFLCYLVLALRGQTYADNVKNVSRRVPGRSALSLITLREFLGPYPFIRLVWPFHSVPVVPELGELGSGGKTIRNQL